MATPRPSVAGAPLVVWPIWSTIDQADSDDGCLRSIAWRPLYQPQFGQTWWGSFGEWQWSHSSSFGTLRARWARRSPCRACETRRLGTPTFVVSYRVSVLVPAPRPVSSYQDAPNRPDVAAE